MRTFFNRIVAWSLAIVALVVVLDWSVDYFSPAPERVTPEPSFVYPLVSDYVLEQYNALPKQDREAILANLNVRLETAQTSLDELRARQPQVLCLGEDHVDVTRNFLAEHVFTKLQLDMLLLEATAEQLVEITKGVDAGGQRRVSLLQADIAGVLRAARQANSELSIVGIEESQQQRKAREADSPHLSTLR